MREMGEPKGMWSRKTVEEVRAAVASRGVLVNFAAKKVAVERMPKVAVDARYPWGRKAPLVRGFVTAVSGDGAKVKVEQGSGGSWWVAFEDVLFNFDVL